MATLTPAHDAVLALIDWLPEGVEADAEMGQDRHHHLHPLTDRR
jgi:hypothetical protein